MRSLEWKAPRAGRKVRILAAIAKAGAGARASMRKRRRK
jgi:hypothetical protein